MPQVLAALAEAGTSALEVADLEILTTDDLSAIREVAARTARAVIAARRAEYEAHTARLAAEYAARWGAPGSEERAVIDEHVRAAAPEQVTLPAPVRVRQMQARRVDAALVSHAARRFTVARRVRTPRRRRSRASMVRVSSDDPDGDDERARAIGGAS